MTLFDIVKKLQKMGYPPQNIESLAGKLIIMSPEILSEFESWMNDPGYSTSLSVEGVSFESLMSDHNMNPIASFLTLDWLKREPDLARMVIEKGQDMVDLSGEKDEEIIGE